MILTPEEKLENQRRSLKEREDKITRQTEAVQKLKKSLVRLKAELEEKNSKINKMQKVWSAYNNLPQLLKANSIFSDKSKAFEFEDINTVIESEKLPDSRITNETSNLVPYYLALKRTI